jgi:hypothetical protein
MATNNLFNVPSWTSIQELFYRRLGINLDPALITYSYAANASPVAVTDAAFAIGTGTGSSYTLVGNDDSPLLSIVGGAAGTTVFEQSNLGQLLLSWTTRQNVAKDSNTLQGGAWNGIGTTITPSDETYNGSVPYWNLTSNTMEALVCAAEQVDINSGQNFPANTPYTGTVAFRAVNDTPFGNVGTFVLAVGTSGTTDGGLAIITAAILAGPGTLSTGRVAGNESSLGDGPTVTVSGLSTTEDTLVQLTVEYSGSGQNPLNIGVGPGVFGNYYPAVCSVLATRVQLEAGLYASNYIPTLLAIITQPADYALSGTTVNLASTLAEGAVLTWSGSAQASPTISVTANPTAPDGSKSPYLGSVTFPIDKLQVSNELPAILVWSDLFPMTVDALAAYLFTNYGYYMEDGEFFVVGDPNSTPLVRGGGPVYNGLNVQTRQFSLRATSGAIRWNPGSSILFQLATSNSIVPANGFSITSGAPPAGNYAEAYTYTYTVTGGTPPFDFSVIEGTSVAPINPSTGVMSSSSLSTVGTSSWIVQVEDSLGRIVTRQDTVTVTVPALSMAPGTFNPAVTVGVLIDFSLGVSGGEPPYTYSTYLNTLPPTVSLQGGAVVGTFEGSLTQAQSSMVVGLQVVDSVGTTIQRLFTFTISDRTATQIKASLCTKVIHWFEFSNSVYSGNQTLGVGGVLFDGAGHANMQIAALPGHGDSGEIGLVPGMGNQSDLFSMSGTVYAHTGTTAFNLPDDFAIMAVVNFASPGTAAGQAMLSRGGDVNGGYELQVGADSTSLALELDMSGTVTNVAFPTQIMPGNGICYHVILQKFDNIPEIVVNAGMPVDMPVLTGTLQPNNTDALFLGVHPDFNTPSIFRGAMGMISLFSEKLWSDERKWIYNAGTLRLFTELGYWPELDVTATNNTGQPIVLGEEASYSFVISGGSGTYLNVGATNVNALPPGMSVSYDGVSQVTLSGVPTQTGFFSPGIQATSTDGQFNSSGISVHVVYAGESLVDMAMQGSNGQTTVSDAAGRAWVVNGSAMIENTVSSGGAMYFPGSLAWLSTPLTTDFDFDNTPFTANIDVYPQGSLTPLISSTQVNAIPVAMGLDDGVSTPGSEAGLYPYFGWLNGTTWSVVRSPVTVVANSWSTVKGVYDTLNNDLLLFVNEQFVASAEVSIAPPTVTVSSENTLVVGSDASLALPMTGYTRNLEISTGEVFDTLALATLTWGNGVVGTPYSSSIAILGGSGSYSALTVTSGTLPLGLTLLLGTNTVVLSGTPTEAETATFAISFQSADGQTATGSFSVTIDVAIVQTAWSNTLLTTNMAVTSDGQTAYGTVSATGGNAVDGTVLSATGRGSGKWYVEWLNTGGYVNWQFTSAGFHRGTDIVGSQGNSNGLGYDTNGWASAIAGSGSVNRITYFDGVGENEITVDGFELNSLFKMAVDLDLGNIWLGLVGQEGWINGGETFYLACNPSAGIVGEPLESDALTFVQPGNWSSDAPTGFGIWTSDQLLVFQGSFANATLNVPYSSSIAISGGNGVYSNAMLASGSLPVGLTLELVGSTLYLAGTPTTGGVISTFTVSVTSGDGQTVTSATQTVTVAGSSSFYGTMMSLSPMAYWRMNDAVGSSTITDATGNFPATYIGTAGVNTQDAQGLIPGSADGAVYTSNTVSAPTWVGTIADPGKLSSFYGLNWTYVQVVQPLFGNPGDLGGSAGRWTFQVGDRGTFNQQGFDIGVLESGVFQVNYWEGPGGPNGGYNTTSSLTGSIVSGETYLLVASLESDEITGAVTVSLYINGLPVATSTGQAAYIPASVATLYMGGLNAYGMTNCFSGVYDDLAFFNTVLDPTQVTELYNAFLSGRPPVTSGLVLHLDASTLTYADGAVVSAWNDLSGAETVVTTLYNGIMRTTGMGGKPTVDLSSGGNYRPVLAPSFIETEGGTAFAVMMSTGPLTNASSLPVAIGNNNNNNAGFLFYNNYTYYDGNFVTDRIGPATYTATAAEFALEPYLYSVNIGSSGGSFRFNQSVAARTTSPYEIPVFFGIGLNPNSNGALAYVSEYLVYSRQLSFDEIMEVESYLATKWGTPVPEATPIGALFANDEVGGWYDFNDPTTVYQDTAQTTLATTVGQPIQCVKDKSGNANPLISNTGSGGWPLLAVDSTTGRTVANFDAAVVARPALGSPQGQSFYEGNPTLTMAFRSQATSSTNNLSSPVLFIGDGTDYLTVDWYAGGEATYLDVQGATLSRATTGYITSASVFLVEKNGNDVKLYQDGTLILELPDAAPLALTAALNWNIGVLGSIARYFDGIVFSALIINRVLTDDEKTLVNNTL